MLILLFLSGFFSCSHKLPGSVEIDLISRTYWFVQERFLFGSGDKKAEVSAEILDYRENPSFFDPDGRVRGYLVEVVIAYSILCKDKSFSGTKTFSEFFTSKDPYSYKIGIQRVRQILLKRIKGYLIGQSEEKCLGGIL